jgi:nucleoside-diphosphate-sugar epimerase
MTARRILIAGCGDLGTALGRKLAGEDAEVWGLRRSARSLPAPLHTLRGDLLSPLHLPGGITDAVYLATPGRYEDEAYLQTYVLGLRNLLAALRGHPVKRLVFVSSTAVYGQLDGEWVSEDSPAEPRSFSGRRMLQGEALALRSGIEATVVRFGGIYGAGRERMLRKVRGGEPCAAEPPHYTNRIHRDDCVGVLAHVLEPQTPDGIYLAVDDAPCTQCELMDYLAEQLDCPRPERVAAPRGGLRGSNKRCSNRKLKDSGYRFLYPSYREGYRALLESAAANKPSRPGSAPR